MTASDLIAEFARHSGLAGLTLNEQGMARLEFDPGIHIDIERDSTLDVLYLYVAVTQLPSEGREGFYARLLSANLFCSETQGATFGVDDASGEVILCRRLDLAGTDFTCFKESLENLVESCAAFRQIFTAPSEIELPVLPRGETAYWA